MRRYAAVAQLDRVTGYEPVGRGFESLQPYQKGVIRKDGSFLSFVVERGRVNVETGKRYGAEIRFLLSQFLWYS